MITAAVAAYSPQNAQAWRFLPHGDSLYARLDPDRLFATADPLHRGGWVSLGAAVENARLVANAWGFDTAVSFDAGRPWPAMVQVFPGTPADPSNVQLAAQIMSRRTHRGRMTGPPLRREEIAAAARAALPGARVLTTAARDRVRVLDAVEFAVTTQVADAEVRRELHRWHRFWPWQAESAEDGLLASNLGMSRVRGLVGRVMSTPPLVSMLGVAHRLGREARRVTDTSTDFLLFTSPRRDADSLFEGGRGWQRAALALTVSGAATHAMTAPVDVPDAAAVLRRTHAVTEIEGLVAFVRAGRSDRVLPPVPRRDASAFVDSIGS